MRLRYAGALLAGAGLLGTTVHSKVQLAEVSQATSSSGTQDSFAQTNGLYRSAIFYWNALPIYTQYKLTEWWFSGSPYKESEPYYEFLHDRHAGTVERVCLLLKGFYLKSAQVASTRDDLLPNQYLSFCKRFQDEVPSELRGKDEVERAIRESLGLDDLSTVFEYVDPVPIGAASIGVVHRAKLRDGREVAVKIQFPEIEERFRNDLATVKSFCSFALPSHMPFLDEIERQFLTEFDYRREAENQERIRRAILPRWRRRVYVPYVVKDLCTKDVMVMELLRGENLIRSLVKQYEAYAASKGLTLAELMDDTKRDPKRKSWAASLGSRVQGALAILLPASAKPVDLQGVISTLLSVHAEEIFREGFFNADPHPGNIMLLSDGRIGLIDYGQCKELSLDKRLAYAKLVTRLAEKDEEGTVRQSWDMGLRTKHMNKEIIYKLLCFFHDRDSEDVTGERNIQQFLDWADGIDPIVDLDEDYVLVGRVSILLRGLGNAFGIKLRVAPYWKKEALRLMRIHGIEGTRR